MWDGWKKSGSRDIRQVLNEKARSILSTHTPENLPDKTVRKIEAIVKKHKTDVV
jgi:trimethylamine:corrinoid methyltransferase-like protein